MSIKRINISRIQAQLEALETKKREAIKTIDVRLQSAKNRLDKAQEAYNNLLKDKEFLLGKNPTAVNMSQKDIKTKKDEVTN